MGLFSKLFGNDNKESKETNSLRFIEDYEELKKIAKAIFPYQHHDNFNPEIYSALMPLCNEFIVKAGNIDKRLAAARFRKEAKASDTNSRYPYHDVFKSVAFGDDKDWDRVVDKARSIKERLERWNTGVTRFNEMFSNVPECEISLNEPTIKRNKLLEMPEIKYSSVGKSFNKDKLMSFVVIYTETTGLKASSERIIQLSAVKYVDWEPVSAWNTYINPKRNVPTEATKVNGITDDMLVDKPTIKEVHDSFLSFVGNSSVVGYNLPFDFKFLYAEGIDLTEQKRKYFDVLSLAKKAYKEDLEYFTLTDVANYNRIFFDAHNSLNDCYATAEVFECIIDEITG